MAPIAPPPDSRLWIDETSDASRSARFSTASSSSVSSELSVAESDVDASSPKAALAAAAEVRARGPPLERRRAVRANAESIGRFFRRVPLLPARRETSSSTPPLYASLRSVVPNMLALIDCEPSEVTDEEEPDESSVLGNRTRPSPTAPTLTISSARMARSAEQRSYWNSQELLLLVTHRLFSVDITSYCQVITRQSTTCRVPRGEAGTPPPAGQGGVWRRARCVRCDC